VVGPAFFFKKGMNNVRDLFKPPLNHFVGIALLGEPPWKGGDFYTSHKTDD